MTGDKNGNEINGGKSNRMRRRVKINIVEGKITVGAAKGEFETEFRRERRGGRVGGYI